MSKIKIIESVSAGPSHENSFEIRFKNCKDKVHSSGESDYIKIGSDYQAEIPEMTQASYNKTDRQPEESLKLWSPSKELKDSEIEKFTKDAQDKYGYTLEQAYGVLYWNKMSIEASIEDLKKFEPHVDNWSPKEKEMFDQAYRICEKDFSSFSKVFPDQTLKSIVEFYYKYIPVQYP